jgi:hypothetical protein
MTLTKSEYTADPKAWYVTRTEYEPLPAGQGWHQKGRSGYAGTRSRPEAEYDAQQAIGDALREEGFRFADFAGPRTGRAFRPVYLEKQVAAAVGFRGCRIEIDVVSGKVRQEEMDDDLDARFREMDRHGKHVWGERWSALLHATTEWAAEAGLDVESPFVKLKVAYLAWDRANDITAALEQGARVVA